MTKSQFMIDKDKILKILNHKHPKCGYSRKELIEKLYHKVNSIKYEMAMNRTNVPSEPATCSAKATEASFPD